MKITNTQPGARGINTVNGTVLIEPKETIEAKIYAREKEHLEASGWFTIEGDYEPNPSNGQGASAAAPAGDDSASKAKIEKLEAELADRDKTIADLKKQLPETDIDKMTVPELRAHLAFRDIAFDSKKDKKDDLVTLAKAGA
jgi:uncharacterized coiled-coil protein SlyX